MTIPEGLRLEAETLADRLDNEDASATNKTLVSDQRLSKVSNAQIDELLKRANRPLPGENLNAWRSIVREIMANRSRDRPRP
jgi:hypothetical protein